VTRHHLLLQWARLFLVGPPVRCARRGAAMFNADRRSTNHLRRYKLQCKRESSAVQERRFPSSRMHLRLCAGVKFGGDSVAAH
jgi:hypothetical protein